MMMMMMMMCVCAHARCTAQAETEVASLTKRVRALEEDFESTETRLVQTQVKLEQASKAADDSERSAHLSILFIHRVPVTSTGPDLRGPRASYQQRASYQTVHILFLANAHLPISCFILFTNRKICGCQTVPARSVAQLRPVFLWDVCLSDSLSV